MSEAAEKPRVDELIARTQKFVVDTLQETIETPVRRVGKRFGRSLVRFTIAATLLSFAAGFLLVGLVTLLMQWLPLFAACLIVGGLAALLGVIFVVF